jgi:hypothetical protein
MSTCHSHLEEDEKEVEIWWGIQKLNDFNRERLWEG